MSYMKSKEADPFSVGDDDLFKNKGAFSLGEKSKGSEVEENRSPKKQVQFDEASLSEPQKPKTAAFQTQKKAESPPRGNATLQEMEDEISKTYNAGNTGARDTALIMYCAAVNETAQSMNMSSPAEQKNAMKILEQCVHILDQNSNKLNHFSELYYETYNNMARCSNNMGNIKQSLNFLLNAMDHVQLLAKEQDTGSVTIIPELSLNICNAMIYLKDYEHALEFAELAINSSKQCITSLSRKLDQPVSSDGQSKTEQERLSQLFISQINLHIQGFQAKGLSYEKLKNFNAAIQQYNNAKNVVEQNFGTDNKMFAELVS